MSTRSSGSWVLAALLRPVTFVLAIVAGVLTGNRTGTFWLGLLAYLIAMSVGRALRTLVRGRVALALFRAIWPAAAAGYAVLFDRVGLPGWANLIVTVIAAAMTKNALGGAIRPQGPTRKWEWRQLDEWGVPDVDQVLSGRWKEL
ncbi:MAG: hypothetical protein ABSB24_04980 [Gaiellaceae bacterium]|jgi:hypothetical protein